MTPEPRGSAFARRYGHGALDTVTEIVAICDQLAQFAEVGQAGFSSDVRTQWAVEMGLIRLGECVNRLPESFRSERPEQPWRAIIGMRNFAAHQYGDLDPGRVWRTLTVDIPSLRNFLAEAGLVEESGGARDLDA